MQFAGNEEGEVLHGKVNEFVRSLREDGPPGQVFDAPLKEKTRRFIQRLRVPELLLEGKDIDFYSAGSEIRAYCRKHEIPYDTTYHILLVFEELVQQILMQVLSDPKILTTVEYDPNGKNATVDVLYNGDLFPPSASENKLSYAVLKTATSELVHLPENENGYTNRVKIVIR